MNSLPVVRIDPADRERQMLHHVGQPGEHVALFRTVRFWPTPTGRAIELAAAGSPVPLDEPATDAPRLHPGRVAGSGGRAVAAGPRHYRGQPCRRRQAVTEQTNASTGTVSRLRRRVSQILAAEHGVGDPSTLMPSRATFYRLVERMTNGLHAFGSAPTRRSVAQRPAGPFDTVTSIRSGEWLLVDSTPLGPGRPGRQHGRSCGADVAVGSGDALAPRFPWPSCGPA